MHAEPKYSLNFPRFKELEGGLAFKIHLPLDICSPCPNYLIGSLSQGVRFFIFIFC